jgi:hypothetical protein
MMQHPSVTFSSINTSMEPRLTYDSSVYILVQITVDRCSHFFDSTMSVVPFIKKGGLGSNHLTRHTFVNHQEHITTHWQDVSDRDWLDSLPRHALLDQQFLPNTSEGVVLVSKQTLESPTHLLDTSWQPRYWLSLTLSSTTFLPEPCATQDRKTLSTIKHIIETIQHDVFLHLFGVEQGYIGNVYATHWRVWATTSNKPPDHCFVSFKIAPTNKSYNWWKITMTNSVLTVHSDQKPRVVRDRWYYTIDKDTVYRYCIY